MLYKLLKRYLPKKGNFGKQFYNQLADEWASFSTNKKEEYVVHAKKWLGGYDDQELLSKVTSSKNVKSWRNMAIQSSTSKNKSRSSSSSNSNSSNSTSKNKSQSSVSSKFSKNGGKSKKKLKLMSKKKMARLAKQKEMC